MSGPITIEVDHVSFKLKEDHSFFWLAEIGEVFAVFPEQDSGNISFGIKKNDGKKLFVKYAGARTMNFAGRPEEAIKRLKQSVEAYQHLRHEQVIHYVDSIELEQGYALLFDWFDGECLHSHWSYPPPLKETHPDSPYYRFRQLSIDKRLKALNDIFSFHTYVEEEGFVAIDFYDGSILYNFNDNELKVCDIDFYARKPYTNRMGRLWGSKRFMSPEEFQLGAPIDERTNVFNMGAIAFGLIGGELDRSFSKWEASQELYEVVLKAVKENREERYQSLREFSLAWGDASKSG
ncbi:protein kinase domain-containing protein [Halalkalibacter hemicellulosilyticus]|uniref:Pkinase n=1 Tax=Halalkalibacter hemicellulosilyticusJCM 9152 TaxID=1236971 RepID=W4QEZ9_9BACI|nr:serine/threonine protein kinase [Halalkalibacter hemicellulosilyticus]GAE30492.1 pkinase [Halalkalibacter hemicellulosilyticusJCM 9152]